MVEKKAGLIYRAMLQNDVPSVLLKASSRTEQPGLAVSVVNVTGRKQHTTLFQSSFVLVSVNGRSAAK